VRWKVTFWLTLFSVLLCIYHYMGYDHDHIVLIIFSPPAWVIPLFTSLQLISKPVIYALTVITWFLIGLAIDAVIHAARARRSHS